MLNQVTECPVCNFPMRQIAYDNPVFECRSCGHTMSVQKRREDTYEVPRDQYHADIKEEYDKGRCIGLMQGCLISMVLVSVIAGMAILAVIDDTKRIVASVQEKQRLDLFRPKE